MAEHIYDCIMSIFLMIEMILVARYVFFLPKLKNYKFERGFLALCFVANFLICFFITEEIWVLLFLFMIGIYFAVCNPKHPIRGFFLILPVLGLCTGYMTMILSIPVLVPGLSKTQEKIIGFLPDVISVLLLTLFLLFGKSWRENFQRELQYRKLAGWERILLNGSSSLLFLCSGMISGYEEDPIDLGAFLVIVSFCCLFLTIALVMMVLQSNKKAYYSGIALLNEHYLEAQVKHFEAYQNAQTETRRIRHDMKNHLHSLEYLLEQNDVEGARNYLQSMGIEIKQLEPAINTGNAFVDAICNGKNQIALQQNIRFVVEGKLPKETKIQNVDFGTIFSNALDNALEAVMELEKPFRWIRLELKSQGSMLLISFSNPTLKGSADKIGKTSKKDKMNHGFGLQNINLAVQRYGGEMHIEVKEQEETAIFCLEILL